MNNVKTTNRLVHVSDKNICPPAPTNKSWFGLGKELIFLLERPLKPSFNDLKRVSKILGVSIVDSRIALEFYNHGAGDNPPSKLVPNYILQSS